MQDIITRLQKDAAAAETEDVNADGDDEHLSPEEIAEKKRLANERQAKLNADIAAIRKKAMSESRKKNA